MSYKHIHTQTAYVFSRSLVTNKVRGSGFYHHLHAPFSSLNAQTNKTSQFSSCPWCCASFDLTVQSLHCLAGSLFLPLLSPQFCMETTNDLLQENMVYLQESSTFLFCISILIEPLLALALPIPPLSLLLYQEIISCPKLVCDSNFFHPKKIERKMKFYLSLSEVKKSQKSKWLHLTGSKPWRNKMMITWWNRSILK